MRGRCSTHGDVDVQKWSDKAGIWGDGAVKEGVEHQIAVNQLEEVLV